MGHLLYYSSEKRTPWRRPPSSKKLKSPDRALRPRNALLIPQASNVLVVAPRGGLIVAGFSRFCPVRGPKTPLHGKWRCVCGFGAFSTFRTTTTTWVKTNAPRPPNMERSGAFHGRGVPHVFQLPKTVSIPRRGGRIKIHDQRGHRFGGLSWLARCSGGFPRSL